MQKLGIVKSISEQTAVVKIIRESACSGNCASCGGCGQKQIEVKANCDLDVVPGQKVILYTASSYILLGMFCMFILPIAVPLFAYILLSSFNITLAAVCAMVSFVFCAFAVYKLSRSKSYLKRAMPSVISRLDNM